MARLGTRAAALPSTHVIETMRPLPIERIAQAPAFVAGISIVRGTPTPVVDLGMLLDGEPLDAPRRLVTLRIPDGDRVVGVLVDDVIGLVTPPTSAASLPPLLADAGDRIDALAEVDGALLRVLEAGRCVPEEVWEALDSAGEQG